MKIKGINVRISGIALAVFAFFTILLVLAVFIGRDVTILYWGIPMLVLLVLIPHGLNYMSQREYASLVPVYEKEARPVRIKLINANMIGQIVRVEGYVERVYFQFLNRPQFLIGDRSGEISVKMFTNPGEKIKDGDVVEVLGQVIKRYMLGGDPVINGVSIRKIDKRVETRKKAREGKE